MPGANTAGFVLEVDADSKVCLGLSIPLPQANPGDHVKPAHLFRPGCVDYALLPQLQFRKGDRVFGLASWYSLAYSEGTYCEIVSAKEEWLAHAPKSLPLHEAGQVPLVALTAWQVLHMTPAQ